jgi:hypothetical protein
MNTPPDDILADEMDTLNVSIFIRDWAGNKSRTVKLPLSFKVGSVTETVPAQWQQAAEEQIGYINNTVMSVEEQQFR